MTEENSCALCNKPLPTIDEQDRRLVHVCEACRGKCDHEIIYDFTHFKGNENSLPHVCVCCGSEMVPQYQLQGAQLYGVTFVTKEKFKEFIIKSLKEVKK